MKFLSFVHAGRASFGIVKSDGRVLDFANLTPQLGSLAKALESLGTARLLELGRTTGSLPTHALDDVQLLPPILRPGKVICVGLNFRQHVHDAGFDLPRFPSTFVRFHDTLVASGSTLMPPPKSMSTSFDFEGEMAVVIGKAGRHISESNALSHVFGYSCFNDCSARDMLISHSVSAGKNFPCTAGFGPFIVTTDEIRNPATLRLITRLNGAEMQNDTLDHMVFSVPKIISYLSRLTALSPGDVIATGTPAGVGNSRTPPVWMQEGDVVEVEISSIGTLRNTIAAADPH